MTSSSVDTSYNLRKNYGKIPEVISIPNLIDIQKESYENFLQLGVKPEHRKDIGLQAVFKSVFPIKDFSETSSLEFVSYNVEEPKYDVEECRQRGMTYAAPFKMTIRLVVFDTNEESGVQVIRDVKEQEVYFGEIPLMTEFGTFIVNGTERVIVSQLHRSPGVFFDHDKGKTHASGKTLYSARIIPYRGSWIDFDFDAKDILYVRIDRRRKLPATVLLKALGYTTEELLNAFYETEKITYRPDLDRYEQEFDPGHFLGQKLSFDIIDAKTEEVVHPKNRELKKIHIIKKLSNLKRIVIPKESLIGKVSAHDVIDLNTGLVLLECNEEITEQKLLELREAKINEFDILFFDNIKVSAAIRETLLVDKTATKEEAIIEIYRRMRPGDPPTMESATKLFDDLFFNPERYDLSKVGRAKLNHKLKLDVPLDHQTLRREDIFEVVRYLFQVKNGKGEIDDIDHLGNRRIRAVGELIENQYRIGLLRMERTIKERMSMQEVDTLMPSDLIHSKSVSSVIKEFFGSSQLSQFMDQTNPLSEVTHKRRLSALGPGGLTRERAGFEVRDVHSTHYGRICPIETPEGPNIGLIASLSTYARVNEYGFIETPYRKVIHELSPEDERLIGRKLRETVVDPKTERTIIEAGGTVTPGIARKLARLKEIYAQNPGIVKAIDERRVVLAIKGRGKGKESEEVYPLSPELGQKAENAEGEALEVGDRVERGSVVIRGAKPLPVKVEPFVTEEVVFLSAMEEEAHAIAQANAEIDEGGHFLDEYVSARKGGEVTMVSREAIDLMDVSPNQLVSVAASLIPFLEHDDANRALMGSNMQRQAVPLMRTASPLVGTGIEKIVARDSGVAVLARRSGIVESVDATRIVVRVDEEACGENDSGVDIYTLMKYQRSNQNTCLNQKPIVREGDRVCGKMIHARRAGIVKAVDDLKVVVVAKEKGREVEDVYPLLPHLNQKAENERGEPLEPGDRVAFGSVIARGNGDVIADGPATHRGELALGQNVVVAFMPWGGYNFEDSILISERLIKNDAFTSIHIEQFECVARDTKLGKEEITRDIPNVGEEALKDLDESGIIRLGAEVKTGDILVGKITPKGETQLSPEEKLLRAIFGEKAGDVKDTSLTVLPGISGTVINAQVFSRKGIDKDERAKAIEGEEIKRLRQDQADELRVIKDTSLKKLARLLAGMTVVREIIDANGEVLLEPRKRQPLVRETLERIPPEKWNEITVGDEAINEQIEKITEDFQDQMASVNEKFEEKINRLRKGDELPPGVIKMVKIYVAIKRKLAVGDKMAGRHGNKGVLSRILPEEDMPYLPDGRPVDIVLNPLGVPSRMNVGQVLETHLGAAAFELGRQIEELLPKVYDIGALRERIKAYYESPKIDTLIDEMEDEAVVALARSLKEGIFVRTPVFDGAHEMEIEKALKMAGLPVCGQTTLFDGRTGEAFFQDVTVGVMYMMKLHHLVDDKIHARSIGPYSLVTQQPLGGKAQFGGQRLGEMEVWALEAYGAAYSLQEFLTVKSDDVAGRTRMYEAIVKGENLLEPGLPESFNVLIKELQSLGLNVELIENKEN